MTEPMNITGEKCPICHKKELTLSESTLSVPQCGNVFKLLMHCNACNYHQEDIELEQPLGPIKFSLTLQTLQDLEISIIKGSEATLKIPHVGSIEAGPTSQGQITSVKQVLLFLKEQAESDKAGDEDADAKKKAKNLVKKLNSILAGQQEATLTLEDPSGNSFVVSEKAVRAVLKKK